MLIDWFTVVAQVINFLVLVWLLKRFLYKPILRALDAREQQIALTLADADAKKAEAKQERDEFQHKNEAFDRQRTALLSQATDVAKAERESLLDQARQDAIALRLERQAALKREQQHLNAEITRRTREEVFAIARKTLTDLAGTSLEARMSEVFARRLQALDDETKDDFAAAVKTSSEPVLVRSAFDLSPEQRAVIQTALNDHLVGGHPDPVRDRAGRDQRHRTQRQGTQDRLEHRRLSRVTGKERRRFAGAVQSTSQNRA